MPNPVKPTFAYIKNKFKKTCGYCGCTFKVVIQGQKGRETLEKYRCPECAKEYKCNAANSPIVLLVNPRTDRRTDRHGN